MFRETLLLCVVAGIVCAQEGARCTMEVTVIDRLSGAPLPKATLIVVRRSAGAHPQVFDSVSDTAGKFSLQDLAPGDYSVTATAEGRSRQTTSMRCEQGLTTVSIALAVEAVVSGRVTDDEGQPAAGARVTLLSHVYADGEKRFVSGSETIAGNDGQFRFESLPEGTYYLSGALSSGGKNIAGQPYVQTFYPSALAIYEAAPIHVRGPGEIGGADIRLRRARAFSMRGRLLAGDLAENMRDFSIRLNATDPFLLNLRSASVSQKGLFEFSGILPGVYTLVARKTGSTEPSARASVTVANSDLDDIELTLTRGMQIAGRLTFEDKDQHTAPTTQIMLISRDAPETASSRTTGGNEFLLKSVPPAVYRVLAPRFAPPVYAKALRVDGRDIPDWIADLTAPAPHSLEVVLGSDGGRVTGYARDGSGNPRANTLVTLAPAGNGALTTPQFATTYSDDQGRYVFTGVQPGAYKVFAWEKVPPGLVQNRQVLSQFESQCADVVVPPNGTANSDMTVISASATAALE